MSATNTTNLSVPHVGDGVGVRIESAEDVPRNYTELSKQLVAGTPPTNPLVIMRTAAFWYVNGKGGTDPMYQWCITWLIHLIGGISREGTEKYEKAEKYLKELGFNLSNV